MRNEAKADGGRPRCYAQAPLKLVVAGMFLAILSACGSMPKRDDLDKVKTETKNQDGGEIIWQKDAESATAVEKEIDALLKKPLTKERVNPAGPIFEPRVAGAV